MTEADAPAGPLAGVRVIDLSRVLAGPLATMTLGDLGADIVKVERPGVGDDTRHWGPPFAGDDAAYFLSLNRNKRSVAVDLATPEGVDAVRRLAADADVVIENFRPGLMAQLGLGLDALRSANPRLVTCSLTAFGEPDDAGTGDGAARPGDGAARPGDAARAGAARPGYDIIVQALSGLMSITGAKGGEPTKTGVALLDVVAGLYAAIGILAALHDRASSGVGRHVAVSLFDASVAAMVNQAANFLIGGVVPAAMGSEHPNIVPYQVFHAADRPFVLAAGNDRLFERSSEVVGHPEWAGDERFATNEARVRNREVLIAMMREIFATRSAADWLAAFEAAAVPCSPIRAMDEVFASPEGAALIESVADAGRGTTLRLVADPIRIDGRRLPVRLPPPVLGAHDREILP